LSLRRGRIGRDGVLSRDREILKVEKRAPLGDPLELVIKGYHLSLRREEGACILVHREA